jgi:hypothetical protein
MSDSEKQRDRAIILEGVKKQQNDLKYQEQILKNFKQLHDAVKKENDTIYSTYYQDFTFNSANSRQSSYVYQSTGILSTINTWGFWIYLALAVVLSVFIVRKEMSIYSKIGIVLAIIAYPFYIYPLEELTYMLSVYIWNLLTSVTYDNGYKNTSLEYGIASGEKLSGPDVSETASSIIGGASYVTGGKNGQTNTSSSVVSPTNSPAPTATPTVVPTVPSFGFESSESTDTTPVDDYNWPTDPPADIHINNPSSSSCPDSTSAETTSPADTSPPDTSPPAT